MKTTFLIALILLTYVQYSNSQLICIQCFDQNDSISIGVNNLLSNGGFESTTCVPGFLTDYFCPNSSGYNCDISNWTCNGGGTLTYASIFDSSLSIIPEGTNAVYFGNGYSHACSTLDFDITCLINSSCGVSGMPLGYPTSDSDYGGTVGVSIEQTVTGLTIGKTYVLEFWAGGESHFGDFVAPGIFAVDVGFGDNFLRCKPTFDFFSDIGTTFILEFNAISVNQTIKFTNWGHICASCTELVLDQVRLYRLEELSGSVPVCITTSKDLRDDNDFVIFPNPFTNEIIVMFDTNKIIDFILYDSNSKIILQQEFLNSISINTEQLAPGVYFYELRIKNEIKKSGKILKE